LPVAGFKVRSWDETKPDGPRRMLDVSKAKKFSLKQRTSRRIKKTIDWFVATFPKTSDHNARSLIFYGP
jgi:hypothetical protein